MPNEKEFIKFKCLEVNQPIGTFYIGAIDCEDLENISYADVRRLELGNENREVEDYMGIQRPLSPKRVKEIEEYVGLVDATFPTSIILAVSSANADYDGNSLSLKNKKDVAKVLDGQHRIAGLKNFKNDSIKFQLNVTIFIDLDIEDQAIIFATINQAQTKVNNSLVADLFEFAKTRSPQKTAHNIARALNQKVTSPFYKKIKILGNALDSEKETITQATFVKCLIDYMTKNKMSDRDIFRRNKTPELYEGKDKTRYLLRKMFVEDNFDIKITQLIFNYFKAVESKWPNAWKKVEKNIVLNRSTGFIALMKFFRNAYQSLNKPDEVISVNEFAEIFQKIDLKDDDFNNKKYIPGSGGQSDLYKDLLEKSQIKSE